MALCDESALAVRSEAVQQVLNAQRLHAIGTALLLAVPFVEHDVRVYHQSIYAPLFAPDPAVPNFQMKLFL